MAWIKVANASDVAVGAMIQLELEDDDLALYHLEDGFYATSDVCTHAAQPLSSGTLDGHIVACPRHGGKFDVRTGQPAAFPCVIPLTTYDVEVRGDEVWVDYE
ncbi:non-heme iron oxygenase ferredoxin subunit [Alicyclobacillus fastidiosus]|uniref:Non-heme iron oxygenase ferredoxin subunit n=1 Tax=Alicyclobacillus fastidiosus TaxID=392011 RepID=A0ABV5ADN8_9BACL|nr:non-heme iron oxygenase ferredoxin subunit [Alicyclobacillus fastidiosus]WEH08615.1 non-heme iron oxygenase ferredoxin subunit [Alicyclobacillus fastidiosus]